MFLNKLLTKLHLRYEDGDEEKEYAEVKKPLLRNFVQIVFAVLIGILIPYTVRYFDKELFPQSYIFVALIVVGAFIYLIKSKFEGCLDWLLLGFFIAVIAVFATAFRDLLIGEDARECFYMGYAFAMIHRLLGFGVLKFQYMVIFHICSLAIKFPMIPNPDILLNIIVVLLDILTVGLCYKSEGMERDMFDSLYKSKKDIEQFKHLLTTYLPNQMAIISAETADVCYLNNSFKKTFKCPNAHQFKETAEKLKIERETLEKNNKLFTSLGFFNEAKEETPLTLSTFLTLVSQNPDTLKQFKNVSFPVIEDLPKNDLSLQVLEHHQAHGSSGGTVTKDTMDLRGQKNGSSAAGRRELSDGRKDGTMEVNDTVKSSEKGSQEKGSKGSSSDIVYEEGRKRVFKVKVFSLLWDEKEAIAIVLDDITQQRIIMELKIADKNKDLVIAMVSHELRTPLNGMLGLIDIAKKNITQTDTLSYLTACRNSGVLLLNLVNSILDLNQINYKKLRLVYTKFSLLDLFDEIKSLFAYNCKLKMLYLETKISPDVPDIIKLDKSRLSQILINLLGNAFKFTFDGGVTLRVDLENQNPLRLRFSVLDTGIGISKEDQEKLFKMYGRLEQQDKKINTHGVGLGLTISNTLAALLNPTEKFGIQVESEVNKGTCFSFIVEPNIGEKSKRRDAESGSMEDLSSNGLNEDRDTTILKKLTVYTINNNENYTKMTSSSQADIANVDPRKTVPRTSVELMLSNRKQSPKRNRLRLREDEEEREEDTFKKISSKEMISEESEESIEPEFNIEQNAKNKKPWCLVVDDNPFNLMVACHIMEEKGFRVKTALNGQEAINRAVEHQKGGETFFIILMDCQMPVMDGYQATRILREMMKYNKVNECPIVALTANNRDEEHDKLCEESGMSGHVAKPLQIKELDAVLKQASKKRI